MYNIKALKRTGNLMLLAVFAFMLLAAGAFSVKAQDAAITSFEVTPEVFNPDIETVEVNFSVNQAAKATINVMDGTSKVKTLALQQDYSAGSHTLTWNGTDSNNQKVAEKSYKVQMYYYSSDFGKLESDWVTVDYNSGESVSGEVVSNHYATPDPFDPSRELTRIYFTLEDPADVSLYIEKNGNRVDTLLDAQYKGTGTNFVSWDGRDSSNYRVAEGTYKYKIYAEGDFGVQSYYGYVDVVYGEKPTGTVPSITDDYAAPDPFDPNNQNTYVYYTLNTDSEVDIEIYSGTNLVKTLATDQNVSSGTHAKMWTGRNNNGNIVSEGNYTYVISADNNSGQDTVEGNVLVEYTSSQYEDPELTNAYVDPQKFDPTEGEDTTVHYDLNTCSYVSMKVYRASTNELVRTLFDGEYQCEGSHTEVWDGRNDSSDIVEEGDYDITITANNSEGSDSETESVDVEEEETPPSADVPNVTNLSVDPYEFDPEDYEETQLTYELEECADVTVKVFDDNDNVVEVLRDDVSQCDGTYEVEWDGEDDDNDLVEEGNYYFKVYAENSEGSDYETENMRVEFDSDDDDDNDDEERPEITDVDVDPERFDPYEEETELEFELNTCADVTIEVRDDDDDLVYEIIDDRRLCEGTHDYDWDGEDEDNDYVRQDEYEFYIRAENSEGSDTEREEVEVDYNGHTVNEGDRCAGYLDVDRNDPYCDAIEYVKGKGIFDGYPDGYFRPYQSINRAETTKVIIKGFDYPILPADGTNLGFWDVVPEAWYMPYLRSAVTYGNIIQGYPDGSFKPAQVVNRVELLKIFLKSANVALPNCTMQPYPDTPIQADTEWYMDFVCYSKMHQLMDTDYYGNFNPAKPMTRGDVAMLFYRFDNRGMYDDSYYNTNERPHLSDVELSEYEVDEGEGLRIYYSLDKSADVTVEILDEDDDVIRELLDDEDKSSGSHSIYWNGEDDDDDDVEEGDYMVRIEAENLYGYSWVEVDLEVEDDNELSITMLELSDDEFDPDHEELDIEFEIDETAYVTVRVYDDDNDLVIELWDDERKSSGDYELSWDGEDEDGYDVDDGDYTVKVTAEYGDEYDRETAEVEVNS